MPIRLLPARLLMPGAVLLLAGGCDSQSLAPESASALAGGQAYASSAPVEAPLLVAFDDINACTGETITLTYTGTARVQTVGDHSLLHVDGSVTTSDGWFGTFVWTFINQGDQVAHVNAHDMEITDGSRQRMIFPLGLEQHVTIDGALVVDFFRFSKDRVRCVGPS